MTPDELPGYWFRIRQDVTEKGATAAANAMAFRYQREVMDDLSRPSPSAPGTPPGLRTGALRRSINVTAAKDGGETAQARVRPDIVYARIQELGGTVTARHLIKSGPRKGQLGYLRWADARGVHFKHSVTLPPRPYLRPAFERLVRSGELRRVATDAIRALLPR